MNNFSIELFSPTPEKAMHLQLLFNQPSNGWSWDENLVTRKVSPFPFKYLYLHHVFQ